MSDIDVDDLASLCLERMQSEGEEVVEEICRAHPEHAARIRGMVRQLQKLGFVEEPVPEIPESFGDYRILERIGGGGMGVVYLAEQKSLGRRVALKLMRPGVLGKGKAKERFAREIEAISKLEHAGICTVYEAGDVEGVPFLAMRYIEGESLASVLAARREQAGSSDTTSGSQETSDALILIEKVARALHAAHEAGLLHRDVKPANIMIDRQGEPVILDFGLARLEGGVDQGLTATGEQLGTPTYMASEQVSGGAIDRRTDVYGLGVTLYECLTLHPPFEAPARESLYRMILSEDPPDPHRRNRSVGRELRIVLARALAKDPAHRFSTALDLAEELRRIRVHEPIRTRRPNVAVRVLRWSQRNRMASVVLLTAVLGLAVSLYFLREKTRAQGRLQELSLLMGANEVARDHPELAFKYARFVLNQSDASLPVARVQEILWKLRGRRELGDSGLGSFHRLTVSADHQYLLAMGHTAKGRSYLFHLADLRRWTLPASNDARFTEDGKRLVLGTLTGEVRVYSMNDRPRGGPATEWKPERILRLRGDGAKGSVTSLDIDRRHGKLRILVSYTRDAPRVWTLDDEPPGVLPVEKAFHRWSAAFLPGGRIFAHGAIWSADAKRLLVPLATSFESLQKRPKVAGLTPPNVHIVSVAAQTRFLALSDKGCLRIFDCEGELLGALDSRSEADLIMHAVFSPSGQKIVVTTAEGGVMILSRDGQVLASWYLESGKTIIAAAFFAGENQVVTGDWGGKITIWTADGQVVDRWAAHQGGIKAIGVLRNGKGIVSVGVHLARLWPLRPMQNVPLETLSGTLGMALSANRSRMLVVSSNGLVRLCRSDGTPLKQQVLPAALFWVGLAPDGKRAVVGGLWSSYLVEGLGSEGEMKFRRMKARLMGNPQVLQKGQLVSPHPWGRILGWNPAGTSWERITSGSVVSRSADGTMYVTTNFFGSKIEAWTQDGKSLGWVFPTIPTPVSLSLSPDMDRLLVGSMDGKAYLLDLATREVIREFPGHEGGMRYSSFSPNGNRIATTATDGTIRVWDVVSGAMLLVLRGHKRTASVVEFLSNSRLVSAGGDGTLRWWSLDTDDLREVIKGVPVPPMTEEEKRRYENLVK